MIDLEFRGKRGVEEPLDFGCTLPKVELPHYESGVKGRWELLIFIGCLTYPGEPLVQMSQTFISLTEVQ